MAKPSKSDSKRSTFEFTNDHQRIYALQGSLSGLTLETDLQKERARELAAENGVVRDGQLAVLELFGTIDFDAEYDYLHSRKRNRAGRKAQG